MTDTDALIGVPLELAKVLFASLHPAVARTGPQNNGDIFKFLGKTYVALHDEHLKPADPMHWAPKRIRAQVPVRIHPFHYSCGECNAPVYVIEPPPLAGHDTMRCSNAECRLNWVDVHVPHQYVVGATA